MVNRVRSATSLLMLLVLLLVWTPASAGGPAQEQFSLAIQQRLSATLNVEMQRLHVPGAVVGIWMPGRGSWVVARGVSDVATSEPERLDDHVRIGSVTKTFTIAAILILAQEGKLSLDDPVSKYIQSVPNGEHITIRMLGNMTSGLFNYTEDEAMVTRIITQVNRYASPWSLLAVAFKHPPYFAPGAGTHYSNTNTVLLGLIVQKVSGQRFGQFLQERILSPLGMSQTSLPNNGALPTPYAHGYTRQTLNGELADATHRNPSWGWTAGAIVSTLADLHTWSLEIGQGTLLSPAMLKAQRTFVPISPSTGYGLALVSHGGWVWHNGSLPGYQTFVGYFPALHASLVVNANTDVPTNGKGPADTIANALSAIVTPGHMPSPAKH